MLHLPVLVTTAEIFFCRPCTVSSANLLGLECRLLSISANSMYVSDVSVQRVYVRLSECCMILLCMWMIIYVCVYIYIYEAMFIWVFPLPNLKVFANDIAECHFTLQRWETIHMFCLYAAGTLSSTQYYFLALCVTTQTLGLVQPFDRGL